MGVVDHQVETDGRPRTKLLQRLLNICGRPPGPVGAETEGPLHMRGKARHLAHLVDHAAGRAAAECDGRGALENLDRLQVKGVAIVTAEITHSVEKDIVAGGKPPKGQV